ncbi:uncharacterized protein [Littorina saxatilis]|uniref:Chitin-binding type-2 domain-containing protein n=1 Tax=Littorina saxatilis TaxID=31220 RepID=A0AAN9B9W4_9CAEN
MMKSYLALLLGCIVWPSCGQTNAETVNNGTCRTPGFVRTQDGACAFDPLNPAANTDLSSLAHTEGRRHKRQAVQGSCPHCSRGVWTVFPKWDDCGRYYLCIDGTNFDIGCTDNSPDTLFFNPNTMRCEATPVGSNNCLFRSYLPPHAALG